MKTFWVAKSGHSLGRYVKVIVWLFFAIVTGCSSGQVKSDGSQVARPDGQEAVFSEASDRVNRAAMSAFSVLGFDIQKNEPLYLEGHRPNKMGLFVGSGGETGRLWLEPLDGTKTRVHVSTEKSFVGYVGQQNWDREILEEMQKSLAKAE